MNDHHTQSESGSPSWLVALRERASHLLATLPLPSRLNEEWRFGDRGRADVSGFEDAPVMDWKDYVSSLPANGEKTIRIVFFNGQLVEIPGVLPGGLQIRALASLPVQPSIEWPGWESNRFAVMNMARLSNGLLIEAEAGADISPVIELVHVVAGENASIFPHTIVQLKQGSKLRLLERHVSADGGKQLCVAMQVLRNEAGSALDYALLQELGAEASSVELGRASLDAGSSLGHFSSHRGSGWARQELTVSLEGREARAEILSGNMLSGNQSLDQRTFQDHLSPGCYSNLLYKNVLDDSAKSVFSGMIKVEQGAHETDAYQSNRNLVLSERAEVDSMPGLEILADNVRCSHGSATSGIDPEETFYLRSRGIEPVAAERMIARGFLRQALAGFGSREIIDLIEGED